LLGFGDLADKFLAFLFVEVFVVLLFDDWKSLAFIVTLFLEILLVLEAKADDVLRRG
jgi:hypothetical protein